MKHEGCIRLDLNNPVFQEQLLTLQKAEDIGLGAARTIAALLSKVRV